MIAATIIPKYNPTAAGTLTLLRFHTHNPANIPTRTATPIPNAIGLTALSATAILPSAAPMVCICQAAQQPTKTAKVRISRSLPPSHRATGQARTKAGRVKLEVYNIKGQLVRTLVDKDHAIGHIASFCDYNQSF